jgi:CHAD domain-containing protein
MSFALSETDESVADAVRRIAVDRIDGAVAALTGPEPREAAVHTVRKRMKQARALVRLVAPALRHAGREERAFRDVARALSGARDAAVLAATFADLVRDAPRPLDVDVAYALRTALADAAGGDAADAAGDADVVAALEAARARVAGWKLSETGWSALREGLCDTYGEARKAMKGALRSGDAEAVHEWRKAAKAHYYHLELVRPLWPAGLKPAMKAADALQEALGRHHDLALLAAFVADHAADVGGDAAAEPVQALVAARQREIEAEARTLGARLFAEDPDAFEARLHGLWRDWRRTTKQRAVAA